MATLHDLPPYIVAFSRENNKNIRGFPDFSSAGIKNIRKTANYFSWLGSNKNEGGIFHLPYYLEKLKIK